MNARIERLNELLKQSPKDGFIRFALAKEMEKNGQLKEAITRLEDLLADDPYYIGAYYHLGALLMRTGSEEQAADVYRKGIDAARSRNDMHALRELQQALAETGSD